MSVKLRSATMLMRLVAKRRFNANYDPVAARRRFIKQRLRCSTVDFGGAAVEPRGTPTAPNTLLYIPGGGFIFGVDDRHRRFVDGLCGRTDSRGWILHYRLAPEHPYPAAHDDALHALGHVLSAPDGGRVTVAADSAGGALAVSAALAHRGAARRIDRLLLLSPFTDCAMTGLSYVYNRYRDPLFGPEAIIHKTHHYLRGANPTDPGASPLWADLHGLPPMQVFAGSTEVMLDDSTRFADKARAAGCDVDLHVVANAPHIFPLLVPRTAEARCAVEAMTAFITADRGRRELR